MQPVTKPIIIVDSIDYEGVREGGDIYGEYLAYRNGANINNLGVELRREGYDIVVLDFPSIEQRIRIGDFLYFTVTMHSGADYMERNAYTLVTLIQQLNQRLQAAGSSEKVVVIGPSMGGQIARYALAYMEHNNIPHNARLFLSLDSPHNGATIPLGLQHFVDYFAGATEDETSVAGLAELNSPAARELTQHHYIQGTAFAPHPSRTQFVSDLASFGNYPSQLRRVAVVNGALDGSPQRDQNGQVIQAGQQAFGLEQRGVPPGGFVGTGLRVLFPLGLLFRATTLASARVYYEPGFGQTQTVLESYYFLKGRHTQEATGPGGSCGLDGAPGGFRYFFSFARSVVSWAFAFKHFYSVRDKACFIPTRSGLGYTQPADNCQAVGTELVCAATTPFDAYYGPTGHNEEHIQLTPANVDFIRNEILKLTPKPVIQTAPNALCPNAGPATYSVVAECVAASRGGYTPPGTGYVWTPGPGLVVVSGQGTASVQVQPVAGFTGTSTVQVVATRTGYAASAPLTLPVAVTRGELSVTIAPARRAARAAASGGTPATEAGIAGPTPNFTCAATVDLLVNGLNVGTPYTATLTTYRNGRVLRRNIYSSLTNNVYQFTVHEDPTDIYLTSTSLCDGQPVVSDTLDLSDYTCGTQLAAYPNPADATLHLVAADASDPAAVPATATLYNAQGRQVRRVSAAAELDTSTLPTGLYYLVTEQNGQVQRHQIRV